MTIELADILFDIHNLYPETELLCRDYETSGLPGIPITISPEDIAREREKSVLEAVKNSRRVIEWPDSYLETLAVYRKIAEIIPEYDTFLFHGSAVAVDGEAYIFTAESGTGKSTHARLWREMLGDRAVMVNDDKPLIRVHADGTAVVYGTPWNGKHHLGNNIAVPVRAICEIKRSEENQIRETFGLEGTPVRIVVREREEK